MQSNTGSYSDLIEKYMIFIDELTQSGYKVIGNIYEEDLLNYLSEADFNDYLMKIEVQIA